MCVCVPSFNRIILHTQQRHSHGEQDGVVHSMPMEWDWLSTFAAAACTAKWTELQEVVRA